MDPIDVLAGRLPAGAVTTDPGILRDRAIDSWALALLRRVRGDDLPVPAAVVFPACTEEVAAVLAWAGEARVAVIPRGGGSGVCGGAAAEAGSIVLDLSRMNEVTGVDPVSRAVQAKAGVRGDQLEDVLAPHGLTTGHYPQSIASSTVGGWIAASSAGQASTGFGAIEDVLLGCTAVLPDGGSSGATLCRVRPPGPTCGGSWWIRRDARGGDRGDAGLPGPAGRLGLAGVRLPHIPSAGRAVSGTSCARRPARPSSGVTTRPTPS